MSYFSPESHNPATSGYNGVCMASNLRDTRSKGSNYRELRPFVVSLSITVRCTAVDVDFKEYEGSCGVQYYKSAGRYTGSYTRISSTRKYTNRLNTLVNPDDNAIPPLILMFVKSAGNADHSFSGSRSAPPE